jgi:hypothetical protein
MIEMPKLDCWESALLFRRMSMNSLPFTDLAQTHRNYRYFDHDQDIHIHIWCRLAESDQSTNFKMTQIERRSQKSLEKVNFDQYFSDQLSKPIAFESDIDLNSQNDSFAYSER